MVNDYNVLFGTTYFKDSFNVIKFMDFNGPTEYRFHKDSLLLSAQGSEIKIGADYVALGNTNKIFSAHEGESGIIMLGGNTGLIRIRSTDDDDHPMRNRIDITSSKTLMKHDSKVEIKAPSVEIVSSDDDTHPMTNRIDITSSKTLMKHGSKVEIKAPNVEIASSDVDIVSSDMRITSDSILIRANKNS